MIYVICLYVNFLLNKELSFLHSLLSLRLFTRISQIAHLTKIVNTIGAQLQIIVE